MLFSTMAVPSCIPSNHLNVFLSRYQKSIAEEALVCGGQKRWSYQDALTVI